jgi:hypothetical protein
MITRLYFDSTYLFQRYILGAKIKSPSDFHQREDAVTMRDERLSSHQHSIHPPHRRITNIPISLPLSLSRHTIPIAIPHSFQPRTKQVNQAPSTPEPELLCHSQYRHPSCEQTHSSARNRTPVSISFSISSKIQIFPAYLPYRLVSPFPKVNQFILIPFHSHMKHVHTCKRRTPSRDGRE